MILQSLLVLHKTSYKSGVLTICYKESKMPKTFLQRREVVLNSTTNSKTIQRLRFLLSFGNCNYLSANSASTYEETLLILSL